MSVLSTLYVKCVSFYGKYSWFGPGGDPPEGWSGLFLGCDHVAFLSALELVNERCRVTDSGDKKTRKKREKKRKNTAS